MTHHIDWDVVSRALRDQRLHDEARTKDLDETRRLLYMALLAPRTKRYNLAGTLANTLIHHVKVLSGESIEWEEENTLMDRIVRVVDGEGDEQDVAWLYEEIGQITEQLDGEPSVS
jgi:hypothetical protein